MADLLPSAGNVPLPYVMSYDVRPLVTMEERKKYWQEAIENDYTFFLEHDPVNECCTIQMTEQGFRLKETFSLREWMEKKDEPAPDKQPTNTEMSTDDSDEN